jgi:acyl-CoA reductase-like NAD-dependent aldehyde dehydrogenase
MVQGVEIDSDNCIVDTNPATGEVIARVPCTLLDEVPALVARARAAQPAWAATPLGERVALLKRACESLAARKEELIDLVVREMGKVRAEAEEEVAGAIARAAYVDLIAAANAPVAVDNGLICRDAHGVVAVCSPWNFPADEPLLLCLPALVAGNTVILKPSEVVPLVGALVGGALAAALPADVFQLVQGDGAVGAALVQADVQMVAMTGSSATGKKIMAACAPGLKRLVLELGGKDPMVVFADADLELAAADAVTFSLFNCGQVCCSVERVYVAAAVKPRFEALCAEAARAYVAADGFDAAARIGPMVSRLQLEAVQAQVDAAVAGGARVLAQAPIQPGAHAGGNWFPATVLTDVALGAPIHRVETFGPLVVLSEFDGSEGAAIACANDSEYGLAAYVYTQDLAKAQRVALRIKAGQVGINAWSLAKAPMKCPWIGAKGSGFGFHSGTDGWRQFSVPKSLIFDSVELVPNEIEGTKVVRE